MLNLIINLLPQAIYAKNQSGKYILANVSYASLYGLQPEQLIGKTTAEVIPQNNNLEYFLKQDEQVIATGESLTIPELSFKDNKGVVQKFHTTKVPFSMSEGDTGVLGIGHNITDQIKSDHERKKIIADIIQRNAAFEQFSYIISHNLRSPIANIIGIKNILKDSAVGEAEQEYLTDALFQSVEKMDVIIQDINEILDYKNLIHDKREKIALSEIVADIEKGLKSTLRSVEFQITTDFSEIDEILTLKSYIHSICYHIISNSIKFRKPGVTPDIHIVTTRTEKTFAIIFTDNGLGFDDNANREHLFGLYKRFHNDIEGRGIGLYMVKTQVEALGGRIGINSVVNKGTKIKIEFDINA
jgi:PAS domain S-box-containing protein